MPEAVLVHASPPIKETKPRRKPTRKETIASQVASLVEVILEGENSSISRFADSSNEQPSIDDDGDAPSAAQKLQIEGAEVFSQFQKFIHGLDKELVNLVNASSQLGGSVGFLSSAYHLRKRLAQTLHVFRENASSLFPNTIPKESQEPVANKACSRGLHKYLRHERVVLLALPTADLNIDVEGIPRLLKDFAKDLAEFLALLNGFPEFRDEGVNSSIQSFETDLRYWSQCLEEYRGQFRCSEVQRFVHELQVEIGAYLHEIATNLSMFIAIGIPIIRFAQTHGTDNLLHLASISTFFSAVTATTMQFSYGVVNTTIANVTNAFWFSSLVFSVSAAVNSFLGLAWKQTMYRSPSHQMPWWVHIWIKHSPLVFLALSVICFSIGLCCFAYSSHQHKITVTLTTVLTALTSSGLAVVSLWLIIDRWIFRRHKWSQWLEDVLVESIARFMNIPIALRCMAWKWYQEAKAKMKKNATEASSVGSYIVSVIWGSSPTCDPDVEVGSSCSTPSMSSRHSFCKRVWKNAMLRAQSLEKFRELMPQGLSTTRRKQTVSFASSFAHVDEVPVILETRSKMRIDAMQSVLGCLMPTQTISAHTTRVDQVQFSPKGKFLATVSGWDRTAIIWDAEKQFTKHCAVGHPKGLIKQIAWSSNSDLLLTRTRHEIKVWTKDGFCEKSITRSGVIESLSWFPDGKSFISVERSSVVKIDLELEGSAVEEFELEQMDIRDVAIARENRLLIVGELRTSKGGVKPAKPSSAEKRLIVYNMATKSQESHVPILGNVKCITMSRNEDTALVSYTMGPAQLWKLVITMDTGTSATMAQLMLRHIYLPKTTNESLGSSCFGGRNDELVLCAGKGGDIHIWDTDTGFLLHRVQAQLPGGDLTSIACNHAGRNPFTLAAGSNDGLIQIWSKPPDEDGQVEDKSDAISVLSSPVDFFPRSHSPEPMD